MFDTRKEPEAFVREFWTEAAAERFITRKQVEHLLAAPAGYLLDEEVLPIRYVVRKRKVKLWG